MKIICVFSQIVCVCAFLALTWRPLQLTLAQEMQMQVVYRLGTVRTVIDDHPEALVQALLFGNFTADQQQMTEQLTVRVGRLGQLGNWLARNDKKMHRGLRIHIVEGHTLCTNMTKYCVMYIL